MNARSPTLFLHADGDSFFVACELTKRPELRGRPVVVGGDSGIAAAMSYEAKKLGIHRAMPVFKIRRQFPQVVVLNHDFALYREISNKMFDIVASYLDTVERYSIDECFAIVTPADLTYFGGPEKLVADIKNEIQETLGVTYSFGLGRTKALAKVASKLRKPDGLVLLLDKEAEDAALRASPIDDVWGIGRKTIPRLRARGMKTAYDFISLDQAEVLHFFNEPMMHLYQELSGISVMHVSADADPRDQKSIQSTGTFRPASTDAKIIWAEVAGNVERACKRARGLNLLTKSVSFFVKSSDFRYRFGEIKLALFTADPGVIMNAIEQKVFATLIESERIRATGVTLNDMRREEDVPRDLFGAQDKADQKLEIEAIGDLIRAKFGSSSVRRASSLKSSKGHVDSSFHPPH